MLVGNDLAPSNAPPFGTLRIIGAGHMVTATQLVRIVLSRV
jgi:hypothetical protein